MFTSLKRGALVAVPLLLLTVGSAAAQVGGTLEPVQSTLRFSLKRLT